MTQSELHQIVQSPSTVDRDQLNDLMALSRQYPYSATLHYVILLTLHRMGDLRFTTELHRRILYIPDPKALFFALNDLHSTPQGGVHPETFTPLAMPVVTVAGTHETSERQQNDGGFGIISDYLEDHPDDAVDIEEMLDRLEQADQELSQQAPAPIEETTTEQTASTTYDLITPHAEESQEDIIQAFLDKGEAAEKIGEEMPESQKTDHAATPPESGSDDELFTETLARIYIRQGKYEQALRIFKSLELKYSKKNSYFAEQIGFLHRLVENSKK